MTAFGDFGGKAVLHPADFAGDVRFSTLSMITELHTNYSTEVRLVMSSE